MQLADLVEKAFIALIANKTFHNISVCDIEPRHFAEMKYQDDGINYYLLPAIVVRAVAHQQLHPQLPLWKFTVGVTLNMQADDTTQSQWDEASGGLEQILLLEDLAAQLTAAASGLSVKGVVSRILEERITEERHWRQSWGVVLWASKS